MKPAIKQILLLTAFLPAIVSATVWGKQVKEAFGVFSNHWHYEYRQVVPPDVIDVFLYGDEDQNVGLASLAKTYIKYRMFEKRRPTANDQRNVIRIVQKDFVPDMVFLARNADPARQMLEEIWKAERFVNHWHPRLLTFTFAFQGKAKGRLGEVYQPTYKEARVLQAVTDRIRAYLVYFNHQQVKTTVTNAADMLAGLERWFKDFKKTNPIGNLPFDFKKQYFPALLEQERDNLWWRDYADALQKKAAQASRLLGTSTVIPGELTLDSPNMEAFVASALAANICYYLNEVLFEGIGYGFPGAEYWFGSAPLGFLAKGMTPKKYHQRNAPTLDFQDVLKIQKAFNGAGGSRARFGVNDLIKKVLRIGAGRNMHAKDRSMLSRRLLDAANAGELTRADHGYTGPVETEAQVVEQTEERMSEEISAKEGTRQSQHERNMEQDDSGDELPDREVAHKKVKTTSGDPKL